MLRVFFNFKYKFEQLFLCFCIGFPFSPAHTHTHTNSSHIRIIVKVWFIAREKKNNGKLIGRQDKSKNDLIFAVRLKTYHILSLLCNIYGSNITIHIINIIIRWILPCDTYAHCTSEHSVIMMHHEGVHFWSISSLSCIISIRSTNKISIKINIQI